MASDEISPKGPVIWKGPFAWPGYEDSNNLNPIPRTHGVYLQTFEYKNGYLIYTAGITRRQVGARFKEHTRNYMRGAYNVLDVSAVSKGLRKELWHGWHYARQHQEEFRAKKSHIIAAVHAQLAAFRVFVAEVEHKSRILERMEAAIMNTLYQQPAPISTIPDRGMFLAPRRKSEQAIHIRNYTNCRLHGLAEVIEI